MFFRQKIQRIAQAGSCNRYADQYRHTSQVHPVRNNGIYILFDEEQDGVMAQVKGIGKLGERRACLVDLHHPCTTGNLVGQPAQHISYQYGIHHVYKPRRGSRQPREQQSSLPPCLLIVQLRHGQQCQDKPCKLARHYFSSQAIKDGTGKPSQQSVKSESQKDEG